MGKIVIVSHSCLRRANRLVYEDIARLSGYEVHIILPESISSGSKQIKADKADKSDLCEIHLFKLLGNSPRNYWFEGSLKFLSRLKPDIIHIDNDPLSLQSRKLSSWCAKRSTKVSALTCENLSYYPLEAYKRLGVVGCLRSGLKLGLVKLVKHKIDHLFTINKEGQALFLKYGFKNVSKIPLGFSSNIFFPDENERKLKRKELKIQDQLVFAYIGRFVKEKGVHVLLEAISKLDKNKDWILLLDEFKDAENTYEKEIQILIEQLNLKNKIKYFDANHFEVAKYMNAADIIVMPSLSSPKWVEQYGRVAPEAMACGKLVVASRTGALVDLIGDSGILFKEGNAEELAKILNQFIISKSEHLNYKDQAIARASRLNTQAQAEKMSLVFQNLLK